MPVVLPGNGNGYNNSISPPGVDPNIHPQQTPAPFGSWGGGISGAGSAAAGYARSIQPIGTAAAMYTGANGPVGSQLDYQRRLLQSNRGIINLSDPYSPSNVALYNANQGVYGAQQGQYNAQRGVYGAQGFQNDANRAVTNSEIGNTQMAQSNFERQLAAHNDINDQTNVALYNEYLNSRDRRNQLFGAAPEQRIDAPNGTVLPSGQVVAPRTNESRIAEANSVEEKRAGFITSLLRGKAGLAGADVADAQNKAGLAGLTVNEARLSASKLSDEAKRTDEEARYNDALLRNDAEVNKLPPFPGAVIWQDPDSGDSQWVTPGVKAQKMYEQEQALSEQRYPQQQAIQQQRSIQNKQIQNAQAGPLGGYSVATITEMYKNDPSLGSTPEGFQNLITYFLAQGMSQQQAQYMAGKVINDAADAGLRERLARERASGGTNQRPDPPVAPRGG